MNQPELAFIKDESKKNALSSHDYQKIEDTIGTGALERITIAIEKTFNVFNIVGSKEEYLWFVLHGGERPYLRTNKFVDEDTLPYLTLEVLANLHDQWVVDNKEFFFSLIKQDEIFKFSPLFCVGWKTVSSYLVFLYPILADLFGEGEDDMAVYRSIYWKAVSSFQSKLHSTSGVPTVEQWSAAIANGLEDGTFYPAIPRKIKETLLGDDTLRRRYAEQIILHLQEA